MATVLLVCTGNICRSPMAQGFLSTSFAARGIDGIDVASCGTAGWDGSPATPEAIQALREQGIDISSHQARRLNRRLVDEADLILTMTSEHRDAAIRMDPAASARAFTLKEFAFHLRRLDVDGGGPAEDRLARTIAAVAEYRDAHPEQVPSDEDVVDPLGLGLESYRAVAWEIGTLCEEIALAMFGAPVVAGASSGVAAANGSPGDLASPTVDGARDGGRGREMPAYAASWEALQRTDPEVAAAVASELERERTTLRLIASENYTSPAVLAALGSTMTNKYAEGYPGRRYYGGCEFVDVTETLAVERAKALFGADHANAQPHAGAQANLAVYGAFLDPRDAGQKVLGMVLAHGGHLTHGSPVNVSGKWFSFVGYEVDKDTETIDMDRVRDLALEHRPRIVLCGYTAYPRAIDFAAFRQVADEVGAILMVDAAHFIGLVAGGAYPSPVPYADVVTFTTHKTLRGPRGAMILCRAEHAKAIDKAVFPMMQGGPLEHVVAAKAVCLKEAMAPEFRDYAHRTVRTARALAAGLAEEGLRVVSGGTDSHLALIDLQPIGMTGADAEAACERVGIALNKNAIPFDPLPPATASGIRVGTPGPATLGMDELEMGEVARIIGRVLRSPDDAVVTTWARQAVRELTARFPAYP